MHTTFTMQQYYPAVLFKVAPAHLYTGHGYDYWREVSSIGCVGIVNIKCYSN